MAYKITENCAACGACIDECPVGAISEGDIYKIDPIHALIAVLVQIPAPWVLSSRHNFRQQFYNKGHL